MVRISVLAIADFGWYAGKRSSRSNLWQQLGRSTGVRFLGMHPNILLATGNWPHFSVPLLFIHRLFAFASLEVGKNSYYVFIQLLARIKTSANFRSLCAASVSIAAAETSRCQTSWVPIIMKEMCEGAAEGKCKACALLLLLFERGVYFDDTPWTVLTLGFRSQKQCCSLAAEPFPSVMFGKLGWLQPSKLN